MIVTRELERRRAELALNTTAPRGSSLHVELFSSNRYRFDPTPNSLDHGVQMSDCQFALANCCRFGCHYKLALLFPSYLYNARAFLQSLGKADHSDSELEAINAAGIPDRMLHAFGQ